MRYTDEHLGAEIETEEWCKDCEDAQYVFDNGFMYADGNLYESNGVIYCEHLPLCRRTARRVKANEKLQRPTGAAN